MENLISMSVLEMRNGLLRGDFSASELTAAHLKRISDTNKELNSFICVCTEEAKRDALAADERIKSEKDKSPLLTGIPVAIKDMIVTKNIETTCASKILKGFIPPYDATAVLKLKDRGAVIIGKTNLDEFAMGSSTEHSYFGPTKNPWDHERVPGGSSGGSAVAVSVGQSPISLGTDTGGSIRQPASLCGVVGIKPTYGRVSRYGAVAYASSFDQIGPFGRTVEDAAIALGAIAGVDESDATSMPVEVPDYLAAVRSGEEKLTGIRIGIPKEYFLDGMDTEVEQAIRKSISLLQEQGAEIVEISLPHTKHALPVYYVITPAEAASNLARYDGIRYGTRAEKFTSLSELYAKTRAEGFGTEVKRRIFIGNYVLSAGYFDAYYRKAQQVRTLIINDFKAAFNNHCDVILTPASPTTAFKLGENSNDPLKMYLSDVFTVPVNLAGVPGISVPTSCDKAGLPIGTQLIGPPFAEPLLLKVGRNLELAAGFDTKKMCK